MKAVIRHESGPESGISIVEALVAMTLIGMLAVVIATGVGVVSRASLLTDQRTTAENLAQSQMEFVKSSPYVTGASSYSAAALPGGKDYTGFSVSITAESLRNPDDGIQKITVSVLLDGSPILKLEDYKQNR